MADTRSCARCGRTFEPKREHARFCSPRCRVAWNGENLGWDRSGAADTREPERQRDPQAQSSALSWAVTAMCDTTQRLGRVRPADRSQAFAVIGDAVWWVTIVDATLVRYHSQVYEAALAALPAAERALTEGTYAGLRFVRNRMGYHADHADFIEPQPGADGTQDAPLTAWRWNSLPCPALDSLPPRGRQWETGRYRAYQDWLAGHTVGETFDRAAAFLSLACGQVVAGSESSALLRPLGATARQRVSVRGGDALVRSERVFPSAPPHALPLSANRFRDLSTSASAAAQADQRRPCTDFPGSRSL